MVDRDDLTAPPRVPSTGLADRAAMAWRRGVPQVSQPHQLTAGGALALDHLLPGFHDEVVALGGIDLDLAKDVYYFDHEGTYPRFASKLRGLGVSRPFLEQCVRDRVYRDLKNAARGGEFAVVTDTMVDFEVDKDRNAVSGIHLREGGFLPCDVYVDAAGRSSNLSALLGKHGFGRPEKLAMDALVKSASRLVKIPDSFDEEWKLLVIKSLPGGTKGGSLLPMEGGLWFVFSSFAHRCSHTLTHSRFKLAGSFGRQVTLAEANAGQSIPLTDDGFLRFAKQLPDRKLHDILSIAMPLTEVSEYRAMRNERLLFNKIDLPMGLLPIGDSVQRLNPIYGQGITVAAQSVITLSRCLATGDMGLREFSRFYICELYRSLENSWRMATASDARFPATSVSKNMAGRRVSALDRFVTDRLLSTAQNDAALYLRLLEIAHFTKTPAEALLRFDVAAALLKAAWLGGLRAGRHRI